MLINSPLRLVTIRPIGKYGGKKYGAKNMGVKNMGVKPTFSCLFLFF